MQVDCWHITGTRFHFGRHGLGQEATGIHMPSDGLFSALVDRLARRSGPAAVDAWMKSFLNGGAPFVVTSTFPFAGKVRFFPSPLNILEHEVAGIRPKDLKYVSYVSTGLFKKLLRGEPLGALFPQAIKLQGTALLVDQDEKALLPPAIASGLETVWAVSRQARVTLGRMPQNSNLFFTGCVSFGRECGLWFGIHWLAAGVEFKNQVNLLLQDLADAGIGADRTAGFGACEIAPSGPVELPDPAPQPWVTLSRYLPAENEMPALQDPRAAYKIQPVGGWLESPEHSGYRRRTVNMLCEGSILGAVDKAVRGQVIEVQPNYHNNPSPLKHKVYRSGLAFAVGMQGERK